MAENRQLQILDDLLKTSERNFEATVRHAATVDDKAQKTSGLAVVFLAVAFGYIKPDSLLTLEQQYGDIALGLLYAVLVLCVVSVGLCLRAMWLRKVPAGGVSLASQELSARFLLQLPLAEIDDEMMAAYKENQIEVWKSAIEERHAANVSKTGLVHKAQIALAAGMLVIAVGVGMLGLSARNAIPSGKGQKMPEQKNLPKPRAASHKHPFPPGSAAAPREWELGTPNRALVLKALKDKKFIQLQVDNLDRMG